MIASVIVDVKNRQVNREFDYLIPDELIYKVEEGSRVKVPFGPRNVLGFVVKIKSDSSYKNLKSITECLDIVPSINKEMLEIAKMMAKDTNCFLIHALEAVIPSALKGKYSKLLKVNNKNRLDKSLMEYFNKDEINLNKIPDELIKNVKKALQEGDLELIYNVTGSESSLSEKYITLVTYQKVRGEKQQEILDYLKKVDGPVKKSVLLEQTRSTVASLKVLLEKKLIIEEKKDIYRKIDTITDPLKKNIILNAEQKECYDKIIEHDNEANVFLLHGVTGSGKTEIYIKTIENALKNNQNALLLVPEISLTPQMVSRFKGHFGKSIACLHSGLSTNEKYDEWRRIQNGSAKVALGARSAIFAPFTNLGIIIIDEEHESSYKQMDTPKYNAIDIAIFRSKYHSCPLILGSATPLVEDYQKAKNGEYILLEIKNRANNAKTPKVRVVNMALELKNGNNSMFSKYLEEEISKRLERKEQVILLLNRRGHNSFVLCRDCGEAIKCPHCDVTLTYHLKTDLLKCHYCGYQMNNVATCPSCGSSHIKYVGGGTEKVEQMIYQKWPNAKVLRMDADTTSLKGSHERILHDFGMHKADILVGTQMIAKGLDFKDVTLVGILMADMILRLPDFRSSERTFELISQVIGRAGRHEKEGEAIIQTYNSNHYSIAYASRNDYLGFYEHEMKYRYLCGYSPFMRIIQILISSKDYDACLTESNKIYKIIRSSLSSSAIIYNPVIAPIGKIKDLFRFNIIIKYVKEDKLDELLNQLVSEYQSGDIYISIGKDQLSM